MSSRLKVGDWIVFKYPDKNEWPDMQEALDRGYFTIGKKYQIISFEQYRGYSRDRDSPDGCDSVRVSVGTHKTWGLSMACFDIPNKRNLPDWW
jgi:hypothetical protein